LFEGEGGNEEEKEEQEEGWDGHGRLQREGREVFCEEDFLVFCILLEKEKFSSENSGVMWWTLPSSFQG